MYIEKTTTLAGDFLSDKPFGKEIFLEGFLLQSIEHITPPGLTATGVVVNQVSFSGGKRRIDIAFELANDEGWALAELKVGRLEKKHLKQLIGYLCDMNDLRNQVIARIKSEQLTPTEGGLNDKELAKIESCKWIGILVGEDIDPYLAYELLTESWRTNTADYPKECCPLEGFDIGAVVVKRVTDNGELGAGLHKNTFVFADKYFPIITGKASVGGKDSTRDYSKFSFDFDGGKQWFGAGKFVEAVVNDYAQVHGTANLLQAFPTRLQGSFGVVAKNPSDTTRFFSEPVIGTTNLFVCNQWGYAHGKGNLSDFIKDIKNKGYQVHRKTPDGNVAQL